MSKSTDERVALGALLGFILLKLALLATAAFRARFVMDEFALLQFVFSHSYSEFYRTLDPIKTVLSYFFYEPAFLAPDSISTALAARGVGLLAALASLLLVFRISLKLTGSRLTAFFPPALLLSFSNFTEHAFRVRTDTIALPFALGALLLCLGAR
jgi:hypothetical protein